MNNYDDIINLPHHVSLKHPQMSIEKRSAQFAPFSALTGYSDAINEIEREVYEKIILSEDEKCILNDKFNKLNNKNNIKVRIIYFEKDSKKNGGLYKTIETYIKKIDYYSCNLVLQNKEKISFDDIFDITEI